MTYICWAHDATNLLHRVQIRTQTTVHSENLLINDGRNRQAIEAIGEGFPELDIVPPLTLVIKSVYPIDRCALMITS